MFQKFVKILGGDPQKREVDRLSAIVEQINKLEPKYEQLSDEELRALTGDFKSRIANAVEGARDEKQRRELEQDVLNEILPEAFAAVREAAKRTIGLRPYDVQLLGGMSLHQGKIAEMRTGEGKTLVATLPLYLNALLGHGAHLVTVNDYLARRDARWMGRVYDALGLKVGVLQMAARTENGRKAFIVDPQKTSVHEDQNMLTLVDRREAYHADITYGTNSEFGFDYLRDNLTMRLSDRVQRGHYYAIVDEVDNILIDEARTPLIISGPSHDDSEQYVKMAQIVRQLTTEDYEINEKDRSVTLTEIGDAHVEELLGTPLRDPDRPEDITPEQASMLGILEQALRAQYLYHRNKEYLVQAGKVVIIDEHTGRLMPGRRWSDGLHQAVEAKEGVKVEPENATYATVTIQNYFRMYQKLAGMSGTALTEAEEFYKIYKLDVLTVPTNLEYQATRADSPMTQVEAKDELGYKYTYYARRNDSTKKALFYRRKDYPDVVYRTEEAKLRSITQEVIQYHVIGRPQLVGTTSVEHSDRLSDRLGADMIRRLAQVLILRDLYLESKNIQMSERGIPELQSLNAPLNKVDVGDLRQLARSLNLPMSFNLEEQANITRLLRILGLDESGRERLLKVVQGGVPHQVLNARKHDEESKIIAKAGAYGAVTIATNMAGRGVDIKLGGEIDEEILGGVNRILDRAGHDAYNMTHDQRLEALGKVTEEEIGIYDNAVSEFRQYMHEMALVRDLGGLHVIGSERHEARRIDNQLRGRAARQGDPGSSRFYLALDDELMRLFGGKQVEGLLSRLNIDESLPIESGIVGRLVENSQERVEGANFDVRKHLLEYDDVLNAQRKRIYEQRDRIFVKEDLSDDLADMLRTDLQLRVPQELQDVEGPWKLIAYLDEIQPPIVYEDIFYPSFSYSLLIDELANRRPAAGATVSRLREELLTIAGRALQAESDHMLNAFRQQLERSEESLEMQRAERLEALDTFFESLEDRQDEGVPLRAQDLSDELSALVHLPNLRLSTENVRMIQENPDALRSQLRAQIDGQLKVTMAKRLSGAVERRLGERLDIRSSQIQEADWADISSQMLEEVENLLERQYERLLGQRTGGEISRDLDAPLGSLTEYPTDERKFMDLLGVMMRGTRLVFDKRTHRQGTLRTTRLNYAFLAGHMLQDRPVPDITNMVLEHLEGALEVLQAVWGLFHWKRLVQSGSLLEQLEGRLKTRLEEQMGSERFARLGSQPLDTLDEETQQMVRDVLGWYAQNESTRQLLLSAISDQWVDYLTSVEALRVSIGLEAYAQRDPLVQYKGRASEMFQKLLEDIRRMVISNIFRASQRISQAPVSTEQRAAPAAVQSGDRPNGGAKEAVPAGGQGGDGGKSKKKRKRH